MKRVLIILTATILTACAFPWTGTHTPPLDARPTMWRGKPGQVSAPQIDPRPPFRFVAEEMYGDSPTFTVTDAAGVEWQAKLGPEAQAETAATRIVDAAGYYVENVRHLLTAPVHGIPRLKRGQEFVDADGTVHGVRFKARSDERRAPWAFDDNPFVGSPELDGLKVLMVLINNYDARTENNLVLIANEAGQREARYLVSDLGASFGRYGGLGGNRTKNDLEGYRASRFIASNDGLTVQFAYRTRPEGLGLTMFVLNPFYTAGELKKQRDVSTVPLRAVQWIAQQLMTIDDRTLLDAFADAHYDTGTAAEFARVVRSRIQELARL